jgi:hypothetical protein
MPFVAQGLVFGMSWFTSTSDSRDEMKTLAKRHKANAYVEVSGAEQSRMYGFADLKKLKGMRSAAAGVAATLADGGIFLHKIDADGTTCLIAVDPERRMPVPGMDLVGKRAEMIELAKKYITTNKGFTIKVYGDAHASEIEGATALQIERVATEAVIAGEIKPVKPVDARVLFATVAVLAVAAAWFSEDIVGLVTPAPTAPVQTLEAQYRDQVKAAVTQVVALNQFPSNVMGGFLPFLATVAGEAEGWKIESLTCTDTNCEQVLKRGPGATSEGLLRALKLSANDPSIVFYDVDYAKRTMKFNKLRGEKKLVIAPNSTFSALVGSWLQGLADRSLARPTVGPLAPLVPANGAKLQAGEMPQVGQYDFTIPLKEADLQAVGNLPDMMTIESIELRREGENKMTAKFKGKYYAL